MASTITWHYRGGVAARALAAIGGGYLLAAASSALLAKVLTSTQMMLRPDAVSFSTMLAFVVYPCAVIWVFSTASALRAWVGIGSACMLCGSLLWLVGRSV